VGSNDNVLDGVPDPIERGDMGVEPQPDMQLQIAAKPSVLCCHLANRNEKLSGLCHSDSAFCQITYMLKFVTNRNKQYAILFACLLASDYC